MHPIRRAARYDRHDAPTATARSHFHPRIRVRLARARGEAAMKAYKIVVFVPVTHGDAVREAVGFRQATQDGHAVLRCHDALGHQAPQHQRLAILHIGLRGHLARPHDGLGRADLFRLAVHINSHTVRPVILISEEFGQGRDHRQIDGIAIGHVEPDGEERRAAGGADPGWRHRGAAAGRIEAN